MVKHQAELCAPWYADAGDGTVLHRYMNDEFMENFLREASQKKLTANRYQDWLQHDKFGTDKVRLRLPVHRTFYIATTEVVCDVFGKPAFSPQKIISSGFVIRKKVGNSFKIWRLKEGVALGWQDPEPMLVNEDPDQYRRLVNKKIIPKQFVSQGYSGEQTFPMHSFVVPADALGQRNHTLLYGFVPLSGAVGGIQKQIAVNAAAANNAATANNNAPISGSGYLAELEWPFGSWDGVSAASTCDCSGTLQEIMQKLNVCFPWNGAKGFQVQQSFPTRAFANWLRMLVARYQVFDDRYVDNQLLVNQLKEISFYQTVNIINAGELETDYQLSEPTETLLDYIQVNYEILIKWFTQQEIIHRDAHFDVAPEQWNSLPGTPGNLYVTLQQVEKIRETMLLRAEQANTTIESSLPFPRYTQGEKDIYFICPFVRYLDDCGCEKISWGKESIDFKVASPLDPEASRPSVIQLPELKDIKKGFANGVTFLTPKSISDAMSQIVPTMDFKTKAKFSPLDACLGYSISFSIPIITLCAMIVLMIVLSLLNLIFLWLPYAILMLPRLCFPKGESSNA